MEETKELLWIIRNFISNKKYMSEKDIDERKLYELAKKHKVNNFLKDWAEENCQSDEIKKLIQNDYNMQIMKDTNQNIELEKMLTEFEKNGIEAIIVKGAIIKEIYPQNYMRQMCDIDIMIHEKDFKKALKIMKNLGFYQFYNHEKHLTLKKDPFVVVEIHRKLILEKDVGHDYFLDVWPRCVKYKNYKNIYQLSREDSYIFCILHLIIHFKSTGIHLRDVLDVYLYQEKYKDVLDYNKLKEQFIKLGVSDFEENIKKIAYKWFSSDKIEDFDEIEKFILNGTNLNNMVQYNIGKDEGRGKYLLNLFFPSYKVMKNKYPVLEKQPVLLPIMWGARIFKDIFSQETSLKTRFNTIKLIQNTKKEDVEKIQEIYKKLGI